MGRVVWMLLGAAGMLLTGTVAGPAAATAGQTRRSQDRAADGFQQRLDRSRQGQAAGV